MPEGPICIAVRWVKDQRGEPLDEPRPVSESERRTLEAMLDVEFPGVAALRGQLDHIQVVGKCHCGCPAVDLFVPSEVPSSGVVTRGRLAPIVGHVQPIEYGETREIIVHVDDGRLSRLAYVSYTNDNLTQSEWPPISQLTVSVMERPTGPPVECICPCRGGRLHVPRDQMGPMYLIEPIPSGYKTVCQPWVLGGCTLTNCGRGHRTVDGVGWVQVPESDDS